MADRERGNEYNRILRRGGFLKRALSNKSIEIFNQSLPPVPVEEESMVKQILEEAKRSARNAFRNARGLDDPGLKARLNQIRLKAQNPEDRID